MASEIKKEIQLEIAHVLFMDIVGYSKLLINEQRALLEELNQIVRSTGEFQNAESAGKLIKIPTGDGMALVFYKSPEEPVECALEISRALKEHPNLPLRMGVHSGPVSGVIDVNERANVAGAGINMAQRVMDCGDAGHILLSKHVAEDLEQYGHWQPLLHDLGECEVKHGVRVSVVNLYTEELGNPEPPQKFKQLRGKKKSVGAAKSQSGSDSAAGPTSNRKYFFVAGAFIAVVGLGLLLFRMVGTDGRAVREGSGTEGGRRSAASLPISEKSIAVLPFENLSRDPDNAYFAVGIQDEILTRLAKIRALKVIARTSTQEYAAKPGNLSEIGEQLGVANILEGSVQKAADQVHINVQLIRIATREHLWAESYNRKFENIFDIEIEVAAAVAEALNATLTEAEQGADGRATTEALRKPTRPPGAVVAGSPPVPLLLSQSSRSPGGARLERATEFRAKISGAEQQAIEEKPTNNLRAYDSYLRGIALEGRSIVTSRNHFDAAEAFREAVKLDPDFALGWARLARSDALNYFYEIDRSPTRPDEARHAADTAYRLRPNTAESLLAKAYYQYGILHDYDDARTTFEQARQRLSGSSDALFALANVARRQGRWDESLALFEEAARLDPRNIALLREWAHTTEGMHRFPAALKLLDRALDIAPDDIGLIVSKTWIYQRTGDLDHAGKLLASLHVDEGNEPVRWALSRQFWLQRRFADSAKVLQNVLLEPDPSLGILTPDRRVSLARRQQRAGDAAAAKASYLQALEELKGFEEEHPTWVSDNRAAIYAGLGRKAEAIQQVQLGVKVWSNDAWVGPTEELWLATIEAQVGENERAIADLERLLPIPSADPLTPALLRLDPDFDSLRGDPRFEKLAASDAPKDVK